MYDYRFSDEAMTAWVLISQTRSAMYTAEERKLAKVGLTPEKLSLLWTLTNHAGPLTPAEIARLLFRASQTIAGLLARMEGEGLVRREPKSKGHPFTQVYITDKGGELLRSGSEAFLASTAKIMSALSAEELAQLQGLMRKVRQSALEELHIELKLPPGRAPGEVIPLQQQ